ncbi:MAG: type II glyceraldehyde-3-phosphate dehydrogenase [Candidatus Thermoplasmatota archaeon]|nr:type II glyceraldehyde-3-phosphate dehydrogenase [Candidatus Thermoplasmatota archaeon]
MTVKVAINGYGTIGKRVADAVSLQDDMEIVGVTKTRPTIEARMAVEKGFDLYVAIPENRVKFEEAGIPVKGTLDDLLKIADVVVDCTPGKLGVNNLETYRKAGVKAIFQGGEKHEAVGCSFNSLSNYSQNLGVDHTRVVSCNTTGLARTIFPLVKEIGVRKVYATMVRRGTDPNDSKKGPMNAIIPVLKVPSHHGPDLKTVIENIDIDTMAVAVPTTLMHLHCNVVILDRPATSEEVISIWENTPRVKLVDGGEGVISTAQIMEMARDLKRGRSDLNEIAVWRDGVHVVGDTLYYYQAIHQESDVVPENVDCIRAMFRLTEDNLGSILKTNKALGID